MDGVVADVVSSGRDVKKEYCPWCWRELFRIELCVHQIPILCKSCVPKFAAQYAALAHRAWLCKQMVGADVSRVVAQFMATT
jgi:hypothetical protein